MFLDGFQSPEHIRRERRKAQELKKSQWWKQQVGPGICHHCGQKVPKTQLTMDHLIPLGRGGTTSKRNVVPSCRACNQDKGHILPVEVTLAEMPPVPGSTPEEPPDEPPDE